MQLVINSPGTYLSQKDGCFQLKNEDNCLEISPQKIESIVITNKAMITTQAIAAALENNIDIIFLDTYGDLVGRIWFAKLGSTALIRRKQLEAAEKETGLELVVSSRGYNLEVTNSDFKNIIYRQKCGES
jgi:CRISPR-associated protein Cas1